ncbi:MAG: patatin-like protein [Rhodobacteraceae bacterium]|nr:patatin-like protein [Paracoccaceae bacterium]
MQKTELRLALVFYGGVSLAIYMHGVSREVLKLIKASAHRGPDQEDARSQLSPSEEAYRDLLDALCEYVDVQIVVDAIAGASAGGVNGIMLARAIAHDLPLDDHRDLWLENADVTKLTAPSGGVRRLLKSSLGPLLERLLLRQLGQKSVSTETRSKLRLFMQAAWFKPPFSGARYIGWMLDACKAMDRHYVEGRSLIPEGQTLDLFVTLTDYAGHKRRIQIFDPALVEEKDHRRVLKFSAKRRARAGLESELGPDCVPELVFSARATSSFPGAFDPASLAEIDGVLADRDQEWPHREHFKTTGLKWSAEETQPRYFVDGSVVMNKPFLPVINAIRSRPASRKVARRLVYVDPVAPRALEEGAKGVPGFFKTIFASLAYIPRNEPISDDLKRVEEKNRQGRRIGEMIAAVEPIVDDEVARILDKRSGLNASRVGECRERANIAAVARAGYAHLSYRSMKVHLIGEQIADLLARLGEREGAEVTRDRLFAHVANCLPSVDPSQHEDANAQVPLISFLEGLDVDYRIRRLRFAVRKLNSFYGSGKGGQCDPEKLDHLKHVLYEQIEHLGQRWDLAFYGRDTGEMAALLASQTSRFADDARRRDITLAFSMLERLMGLEDLDHLHDDLFASLAAELLPENCYRELLNAWIGFAFFDLATLPVVQSHDVSEISETLVARISPKDAGFLKDDGYRLKGAELMSFGAFFNRASREHDYLCGRISAAERLVATVLSVADVEGLDELAKFKALRRRVIEAIFEEEEPLLRASPETILNLKAKVLSDL